MNRLLMTAGVAFAGIGMAPAAANELSAGIALNADVDAFCRLSVGEAPVGVDGSIGPVRETCNTPGGYVVRADFANLTSGTVRVDGDTAELDENGQAFFASDQARRRTRLWSVLDGVRTNPGAPVIVRLSITPL